MADDKEKQEAQPKTKPPSPNRVLIDELEEKVGVKLERARKAFGFED